MQAVARRVALSVLASSQHTFGLKRTFGFASLIVPATDADVPVPMSRWWRHLRRRSGMRCADRKCARADQPYANDNDNIDTAAPIDGACAAHRYTPLHRAVLVSTTALLNPLHRVYYSNH